MSFFDRLRGRKPTEPPPPMPPPVAPTKAAPVADVARTQPKFLTVLEAMPGVLDALSAWKAGNRFPIEKLYRGSGDGGLRYAIAKRLCEDAPEIEGPQTPFDKVVNEGDPLWQAVRGMYHVKVGWTARGGGTADTVSKDGWNTLGARCKMAVEDLQDAAATEPDDDISLAFLMHAARGLSDEDLGEEAYRMATARKPNSWAAAFQRVEWLSPRWFGSIDKLLAFARAESARAGTGEIAAVPILAHNDLNIYHIMFEDDREAAKAARMAAAAEIRDCCARSVDAHDARPLYSTALIRHYAGSLLWQVADEDGAKAQLSKVGMTYEPWCWMQSVKAYTNVRTRLGLD